MNQGEISSWSMLLRCETFCRWIKHFQKRVGYVVGIKLDWPLWWFFQNAYMANSASGCAVMLCSSKSWLTHDKTSPKLRLDFELWTAWERNSSLLHTRKRIWQDQHWNSHVSIEMGWNGITKNGFVPMLNILLQPPSLKMTELNMFYYRKCAIWHTFQMNTNI